MTAPESAPVGGVEACCEHSLRWHHEERGCGYHGYAPEHRCPCLLTFDEALDADRARVRAETLAEAADAIVGYAWQPGDGIPVPVDQQALYVEAVGNAIDVSARVLRGMAEAGDDQ